MAGKPLRVVAGLIVRLPGPEFFAQQRLPGGPRGSLWEFPGGKVEPGESDQAALVRELQEELGVVVEVGEQLAESQHAYPDLELTLVLYRCRILSGTPELRSAQALTWGTADTLAKLSFAAADLPFIPRLRELTA